MAAVFSPAGTDEQMLKSLCRAAEQALTARLRAGVQVDDCYDSFVCAAALLAVSFVPGPSQTGRQVRSFTVGEVSVTAAAAEDTGASACLRTQAELLMAPYCVAAEGGFAFTGVRG